MLRGKLYLLRHRCQPVRRPCCHERDRPPSNAPEDALDALATGNESGPRCPLQPVPATCFPFPVKSKTRTNTIQANSVTSFTSEFYATHVYFQGEDKRQNMNFHCVNDKHRENAHFPFSFILHGKDTSTSSSLSLEGQFSRSGRSGLWSQKSGP